MDKYDRHLEFLTVVTDFDEEQCKTVFMEDKRDVRKALWHLLQPSTTKEDLMEQYFSLNSDEEKSEVLEELLHCYCPNARFNSIATQVKKGKLYKLDTVTAKKLGLFRRPPNKEELAKLLSSINAQFPKTILTLLKGLQSFGRELPVHLFTIQGLSESENIEIAKAALDLIGYIPNGPEKAIMALWTHLSNPALRFHALKAMQHAYQLSPEFLSKIFQPLVAEYERLCRSEGPINDLWEEVRMMRTIMRNNGGDLWIPTINIGRR
ncbi:MAG: hypothetical protein GY810_07615 [Aureispira sp.]|nr:hypothetical protein [Aureispira sp.]